MPTWHHVIRPLWPTSAIFEYLKHSRNIRVLGFLKRICVYFSTAQRLKALADVQSYHVYPKGAPANDGATRVSSVHRLLTTSIFHHHGMTKYYEKNQNTRDPFVVAWESLASSDWNLILEMECLARDLAKYSLEAAQRKGCLASETLIWRDAALRIVNSAVFHPLGFRSWDASTALTTIGQSRSPKPESELSDEGKQCRKRLQVEIVDRFGGLSKDPKVLLAYFLDPRTAPFSQLLIGQETYDEAFSYFEDEIGDVLAAMKPPANDETHVTEDEPADEEEDDLFNISMPANVLNVVMPQVEVESSATANQKMAKDWITHCRTIDWNRTKDKSNTVDLSKKKSLDLVEYADPFMWFRLGGKMHILLIYTCCVHRQITFIFILYKQSIHFTSCYQQSTQ